MAAKAPVWFITAASSGFGHEIAVEALKRGHTVVATARDQSRIQDLADAGAETLAYDVTSSLAGMEAVARGVFARHGRVDYLINAAGYCLEGAVEEASPAEVRASFDTNVLGVVSTVRAFLPGLRAQAPGSGPSGYRAVIAIFGSMASWYSGPSHVIYCMTKWSCSALAEGLSVELAPFKIGATVVEPGAFRTGFLRPGAKIPSAERLPAYDDPATPSGHIRRALEDLNGNQQGDTVKGSKVVVDVLTQTGVAAGKPLPVRVPLGTDSEQAISNKCTSTMKLLDEWRDVVRSTDYPPGE